VVTGIGGVHANFMYEEILSTAPHIDFVLRGEGELTAPDLMSCLSMGRDPASVRASRTGTASASSPPRNAPSSSRSTACRRVDLVDWDIYRFYPMPETRLAIVSSSRGCNQACSSAASSRSGSARGAGVRPRTSWTSCRCFGTSTE